MVDYNAQKGKVEGLEKPTKPPEKMLFIPANNSTTGVFQLLSDSNGKGLIFETEGDTLAQAFKSDYGNYSDGFRKAFHHETISYYRRTDREYVDIESPCLSTVLSGTPQQVSALIPSAENGLFSRFMFYSLNLRPIWKDVFARANDQGLEEYFDNLAKEFYALYQMLQRAESIEFSFSPSQQAQFHEFFTSVQEKYLTLQGNDYMATVRRLGLIAFRLAMIMSALRIMETGEESKTIICEDRDFRAVMTIVRTLVKHASHVFSELPLEQKAPTRKNRKEKFLDLLPQQFNRQQYLEIAQNLNVAAKTAEGYITEFCKKGLLHREAHDCYLNPQID